MKTTTPTKDSLHYAATAALFLLWVITLVYFPDLPEEIPIHYNNRGEADGYGSRFTSLILPSLGTLIYFIMPLATKLPKNLNTGNWPNPSNPEQEQLSEELLLSLRTFLLVGITYLNWAGMRTALGQQAGLGEWFTPVFLGGLFVLVGYYVLLIASAGKST
ncbi:MAG: DUF1648 domain-containing protein [Bacteroidota bacterium]